VNTGLALPARQDPLVGAPPIDLWPRIVARCAVPTDTHALLVVKLDEEPHKT
jgi:hypothetical protein